MLRKLILSAVLAGGTVTGLSLTPNTADAHPPVRRFHHDVEVIYRSGRCWEVYGHYRNRFEADRVAQSLRCRGYAVEIRPC
jgi:hypothetical protein